MEDYLTNKQLEILKKGYNGYSVYPKDERLSKDYTDLALRKIIILSTTADEKYVYMYSVSAKGIALVDKYNNSKHSDLMYKLLIPIITGIIVAWITHKFF